MKVPLKQLLNSVEKVQHHVATSRLTRKSRNPDLIVATTIWKYYTINRELKGGFEDAMYIQTGGFKTARKFF